MASSLTLASVLGSLQSSFPVLQAQQSNVQYALLATVALASSLGVRTVLWAKPTWQGQYALKLRSWHIVGLVLLSAALVSRTAEAGYLALSNMYESVLGVAWAMQLALAWQERHATLLPLYTLCQAVVVAALLWALLGLPQGIAPLQPALLSYWRAIHVPVILTAYAWLFLASLGSAARLLLRRQAPVEQAKALEDWSLFAVSMGFPLLLVGVALGAVWANESWGTYWNWDPKESMALATLVAYGGYWHLAQVLEWSGPRLAWVGVAALAVLLLTYVGVNTLGVGLHSYGGF